MKPIRTILIATDFGEPARAATELGRKLAGDLGASLAVVHVCAVPALGYGEAIEWPVQKIREAAQKELDRVVLEIRNAGETIEPVLETGVPWERILAAAASRDASMIVMGTNGRRGLERMALGSVAEKVVRTSPVPVVTVRG